MLKNPFSGPVRNPAFLAVALIFLTTLLSYQNCGQVNFTKIAVPIMNNAPLAGPPICQPFVNGSGAATGANGIASYISYIPSTSPVISAGNLSTASFLQGQPDVQIVQSPLYLSQFSVFTQNFSLGFQAASGQFVTDSSGAMLNEYFALHSAGYLGLASQPSLGATTPGTYQFALLSDDGSVFSIGDGAGNFTPLIANDGNHSNRFACAQATVNLQNTSFIPFKMEYYQGPRTRISLMLFWRLVDPNNSASLNDPLCPSPSHATTAGDTTFFGVDQSSGLPVPTTSYYSSAAGSTAGILNRGWQVVPAGNFFLPPGISNPCN